MGSTYQTIDVPSHLLMAKTQNKIPLLSTIGIGTAADLKIARWKAQLDEVETDPRSDYHTISYSIAGSRVERLDQNTAPLLPKTFYIQPGHYSGRFRSVGEIEYVHFYLKISSFKELVKSAGYSTIDDDLPDAFGVSDPTFSAIVDACINALMSQRRASRLELDTWAQVIGFYLLSNNARFAGHRRSSAVRALSKPQIAGVLDVIDERIDEDLSLATLAGLVGLEPYEFARVFRKTIGTTPHQYVLERRTARAQEMLLTTEEKLSDIAFAVGFSSQSHMTDVFKRRLGITPRQYRQGR
ncbi:MAG: AraC family transcriptional regulator [Pseudomonadota bacterium]